MLRPYRRADAAAWSRVPHRQRGVAVRLGADAAARQLGRAELAGRVPRWSTANCGGWPGPASRCRSRSACASRRAGTAWSARSRSATSCAGRSARPTPATGSTPGSPGGASSRPRWRSPWTTPSAPAACTASRSTSGPRTWPAGGWWRSSASARRPTTPRYLHIDGAWRDHVGYALTTEDVAAEGGLLARWHRLRGVGQRRPARTGRSLLSTASASCLATVCGPVGGVRVPTSVLLAVLAAAGLLALAPALTRRYDATERVAAERATSTARVLSRRRRRRTVPAPPRPVNPPPVLRCSTSRSARWTARVRSPSCASARALRSRRPASPVPGSRRRCRPRCTAAAGSSWPWSCSTWSSWPACCWSAPASGSASRSPSPSCWPTWSTCAAAAVVTARRRRAQQRRARLDRRRAGRRTPRARPAGRRSARPPCAAPPPNATQARREAARLARDYVERYAPRAGSTPYRPVRSGPMVVIGDHEWPQA